MVWAVFEITNCDLKPLIALTGRYLNHGVVTRIDRLL